MIDILGKLLRKRGLNSVDELDTDEHRTWDSWKAVLSKGELTIEDIKQFCQNQVEIIEAKWKDLNIEHSKKSELIPYHTVYKVLLSAIGSPQAAREALEKNLIQLL